MYFKFLRYEKLGANNNCVFEERTKSTFSLPLPLQRLPWIEDLDYKFRALDDDGHLCYFKNVPTLNPNEFGEEWNSDDEESDKGYNVVDEARDGFNAIQNTDHRGSLQYSPDGEFIFSVIDYEVMEYIFRNTDYGHKIDFYRLNDDGSESQVNCLADLDKNDIYGIEYGFWDKRDGLNPYEITSIDGTLHVLDKFQADILDHLKYGHLLKEHENEPNMSLYKASGNRAKLFPNEKDLEPLLFKETKPVKSNPIFIPKKGKKKRY